MYGYFLLFFCKHWFLFYMYIQQRIKFPPIEYGTLQKLRTTYYWVELDSTKCNELVRQSDSSFKYKLVSKIMCYGAVENKIINSAPSFSSYTGTPRTEDSCDADWGQVAFIVNTCQALASIPCDPQCLTVPQLSWGSPGHKIIWGNQLCTNQVLKSYSLRGSFKGTTVFQWFSAPLYPFKIPVLTCFSVGLHTAISTQTLPIVSQYWIFYTKT